MPRSSRSLRLVGRPRTITALFALAACISLGDKETKRQAAEALPDVARIGTHLYAFVAYAETMRGWGRTMRWAVSNWYDKNPEQLAYQAIKYRQRDGWSHRDLLRLAHPKNEENAPIFDWIARPGLETRTPQARRLSIEAFAQAQKAETPKETAALVREYNLPREALQTEHLKDVEVWKAMLETGMPMTAMVRNLATMTRNGTLEDGESLKIVIDQIGNDEAILKSRLHPLSILTAQRTYASGRGFQARGEGWTPKPKITDALDEAFYTAFGNVEPTGKSTLLALDISGSMGGGYVAGSPLTPRDASAALALVTLAVEDDVEVIGFSHHLISLGLSSRQRLDDAIRVISGLPFGGTDCALPMMYATIRTSRSRRSSSTPTARRGSVRSTRSRH